CFADQRVHTTAPVHKAAGMTREGVGQDVAGLEEFDDPGQNVVRIYAIGPRLWQLPHLAEMDIHGELGVLANARREPHDLDPPARKATQLSVRINTLAEIGIFLRGAYRSVDIHAIRPVERRIEVPFEAADEIGR